jgi:uncharacterized membrane protein
MSAAGDGEALSETTRLEAFSDGVFAIAITLLIIEVKVPSESEVEHARGLWAALSHHWPSYVGYVISFVTIGIMWANHHAVFTYVRKTDRGFLLANVFLLMTIAFLPFPTAVLADYLSSPQLRLEAAVFYGLALVLTAVGFNVVWFFGVRGRRLLGDSIDEAGVRTISARYRLGVPCYALTTAAAFLNVALSLGLHLALALLYARSEKAPAR